MSVVSSGEEQQTNWSKATIASVPNQNGFVNESSNLALSAECWDITKRDPPLSKEHSVQAMDHAQMVLEQRLSNGTEVLDIFQFETNLARFQNSEIELGKRLASGNFADIFIVKDFHDSTTEKTSCSEEQISAADEMKTRSHPTELVVKVLRAQLLGDPSLYATGSADILTEGALLACIDHPHVVAIKGRSIASIEGFGSGRRDAFFLLLERLRGTLQDQLKDWQTRVNRNRAIMKGGIKGRIDCRATILRERVTVLKQLSDAMAYLHGRRIIHRDLKLSNVGIDASGNVKLLDFGLAKILPPHQNEKETFLLTGNTGSVRYMAPEIGRGEKYNLKADVFSFSILLHEVLNLNKAWNGLRPQEIREKVHHQKIRPAISVFWPATLKELLRSTWSDIPAARLAMEHIHTILQKELEKLKKVSEQ